MNLDTILKMPIIQKQVKTRSLAATKGISELMERVILQEGEQAASFVIWDVQGELFAAIIAVDISFATKRMLYKTTASELIGNIHQLGVLEQELLSDGVIRPIGKIPSQTSPKAIG